MYVKDNMVKNPHTVTMDLSISAVLDIMSTLKLHRLPVVDENNKLLGLLTESLIAANTPNNATSLSVFELNYLLNKLTVKDIMIKEPIVISQDALLEEAATKMRKYDIGCLPVVDKENNLLGIITHNDIFEAFIALLGYNNNGSRYVINVQEDKLGIFENISGIFTQNEVSISNVAVYKTERGIEIVVIATDKKDISKQLKDAGYNVTNFMILHN